MIAVRAFSSLHFNRISCIKDEDKIIFIEIQELMSNIELFDYLLTIVYYLVDPASNHMLVSKAKPCKCKFKFYLK